MKHILFAAFLCTLSATCIGQAVTLTVSPVSGRESVTPTATWATQPAATSCAASGAWSGAKAASGTQVLPAVTSDADYTLTCTWPGALGTAVIAWTPPTKNTDGSPLTDLGSHHVRWGTRPDDLDRSYYTQSPTAKTATITGLSAGTWYFGVRAVNTAGTESDLSNVKSKVVTVTAVTASKSAGVKVTKVPAAPTDLTVVETTAYNLRADFQKFAFVKSTRWGKARLGAACDESRCLGDYCVVVQRRMLEPQPAEGEYKLAKCG